MPRLSQNLCYDLDTAPYAITGGNDKKLRYWDFNDLSRRSYQINTPDDSEVKYSSVDVGNTQVVTE